MHSGSAMIIFFVLIFADAWTVGQSLEEAQLDSSSLLEVGSPVESQLKTSTLDEGQCHRCKVEPVRNGSRRHLFRFYK